MKQIVTKSATFADVLFALERQYPSYETDLFIRPQIQSLAMLPKNQYTTPRLRVSLNYLQTCTIRWGD